MEKVKELFVELCKNIFEETKSIDSKTTWGETINSEPDWWLDMMEIQRIASKYKEK